MTSKQSCIFLFRKKTNPNLNKKGIVSWNCPVIAITTRHIRENWRVKSHFGLLFRIGDVTCHPQFLFLFLPEPALWPWTSKSFLYFGFLICKAEISQVAGTLRNQLGLRVLLHWHEIGSPRILVDGNKAQQSIRPKLMCCWLIFTNKLY